MTRLENDQPLQDAVLSFFHAMMVTFQSSNALKIIENHKGKGHYLIANVVIQGASNANAPAQQGASLDPQPVDEFGANSYW